MDGVMYAPKVWVIGACTHGSGSGLDSGEDARETEGAGLGSLADGSTIGCTLAGCLMAGWSVLVFLLCGLGSESSSARPRFLELDLEEVGLANGAGAGGEAPLLVPAAPALTELA
jgi:hypothetical protein